MTSVTEVPSIFSTRNLLRLNEGYLFVTWEYINEVIVFWCQQPSYIKGFFVSNLDIRARQECLLIDTTEDTCNNPH